MAWPFLLLLLSGRAVGFITRIYSLKEVLNESTHVYVGRLEKVDRNRRLVVGAVERALKGRAEFKRIQMNIGTGPGDHARYLLRRLTPGVPFIIYYKHEGRNFASCVHAGDTWFQLFATDERDRKRVWWRFSHLEVYMGRTFNGSTRDLVRLTADVIARRVAPPKPNPKVPRLDPRRAIAARPPKRDTPTPVVAPPRRIQDDRDGLEAVQGWYADDSWARPANLTIESSRNRGRVMSVRCDGHPAKKLALVLLHHVDFSTATRLVALVDNGCDRPLTVSVAFGVAPDWAMYEAPGVVVPPGARAASVSFSLLARHFKCKASKWQHNQPIPHNGRIDKIMLLVEGIPSRGTVRFDRIRGARGGFHRRLEFPHGGGEIRGISWADVNGDGRLDATLCCQQGNALLVNEGDTFRDRTAQFGLRDGSRSASWADYNGDDHPDLLTSNFQLFTNAGGRLRDDAKLIPAPPGRNPEGAGWIDYNGDGLPDILITNGEHGIRLFENTGKGPQWFRDVSERAGLGRKGLGRGNGDFVAFADYDGDGYTDFLYNLGDGVLAHNEGDGSFTLDTGSGTRIGASNDNKRGISFADYDNDGDLDFFVPGRGRPLLYRNNNDGTFTDVIAAAGDLAGASEPSFAAAWGDVNNDGFLDLFVCHTRGPSRLYVGDGKGKFKDVTGSAGLDGLTPAFAASFADVDDDGDLDLMVNLDRKAVLAINEMDQAANHGPLTVRVQAGKGVIGAVVRVLDEKGRPLGLRELNGAESCGGQACPVAHFGLSLGKYRVSVCLSDGRVAQKLLTIGPRGARLTLREEAFK